MVGVDGIMQNKEEIMERMNLLKQHEQLTFWWKQLILIGPLIGCLPLHLQSFRPVRSILFQDTRE